MAHITLYRRFRPTTWDNVIGQSHIVTTLINQINNDTVSHAYLFTGTRGTGKTSSAKIFAKAVNCLHPKNGSPCGACEVCLALQKETNIDIVEMDAASNNGVDEIRELRESIQYPPTIGKYKVYIIDEVHMLTGAAFNALLKTLEEPPAHAIFILATTEVHKLPATILSRCMRFDFRLVGVEELIALLVRVFDEIGYKYDVRALEQLALHGEGSVRDTLSLAEMCQSFAPDYLSYDAVLEVLGASDFTTISSLCNAILKGDLSTVLATTNKIYQKGKGISTVNKELSSFVTNLIAVKNIAQYKASFTDEEYPIVKNIANNYDNYRIGRTMEILASTENLIKYSTQPKIIFEAALIKASELQTEPNIEALGSRVRMLENTVKDLQANGISLNTATVTPSIGSQTATLDTALSQQTTVIDCTPVFDTAAIEEQVDDETEKIWGMILTKLREDNNTFIYFALKGVATANLSFQKDEKILLLTADDMAVITLLSNNLNCDIVDGAIKAVCGNLYSFHFATKVAKSTESKKDRATLSDLFGTQLVDKTKK